MILICALLHQRAVASSGCLHTSHSFPMSLSAGHSAQGARHVSKNIAGRGIANPTAVMLSASMMLRHLQLHSFSDRWVTGVGFRV